MAETKKKKSSNPVFNQLAAIETELARLRPIHEQEVVNNPITDKKRLNRLALENAKINRKNLGIGKPWIEKIIDPNDGLDTVISKLEKRQNLLQRTLATREHGPGAKISQDVQGVLSEFGVSTYKSRREGLKTLMVGDNPYYDQRYDHEVIASKKTRLSKSQNANTLKVNGEGETSTTVKPSGTVSTNYPSTIELKQQEAQVKNRDPKDTFATDIWTVDPRTGKEVGVITRAERRNLETYLQQQNKKPTRSPGLYISHTT